MITRRSIVSGIAAAIGLHTAELLRRDDDANAAALVAQVNEPLVNREAGARACAALLALLGMDHTFDFGSARDACRVIMAVEQLLWAKQAANAKVSVWEMYGCEDSVIPMQRLAELVSREAEEEWGSTGYDASRIQRMLELSDYLIAKEFIRQEGGRIAPDPSF